MEYLLGNRSENIRYPEGHRDKEVVLRLKPNPDLSGPDFSLGLTIRQESPDTPCRDLPNEEAQIELLPAFGVAYGEPPACGEARPYGRRPSGRRLRRRDTEAKLSWVTTFGVKPCNELSSLCGENSNRL